MQKIKWSFEAETEKYTRGLNLASEVSKKMGLEVKSMGNRLNDLYKIEKKVGSYAKLQDQLKASSKQFELSKAKVADMEAALKKVQVPTVAMVKDLYRARERTAQLDVKVASLTQKTNTLSTELKEENVDLRNLSDSTKRLAEEKKKLSNIIDTQTQKEKKSAQVNEKSQERYAKVNAMANSGRAAMGWGKSVLGSVAAPVSTYVDFEAMRSKLEAKILYNKTDEERKNLIKELEGEALKHGASTSYSASQVLEAQIVMGSAGANIDEIKAGMGDILSIAKATDTSLADAVGVSQGVLNQFSQQFKGGYSDIGKIGDILVAATNSAKLELGDLRESLKNTGAMASAFGADLETTSSLIEVLAKNSTVGSDAGSHLKIMFNRLMTLPADARKQLKKLRVSVSEDGKMRDVKAIVGDVAKAVSGMTDEQKGLAAKNIAGSDAVGSFLAILKEANKEIKNEDGTITYTNNLYKLTEAYKNAGGVAQRMSGIMSKNVQTNLSDLGAKWENLSLKLGAAIEGPLNKVIDTLEVAVDWMSIFVTDNEGLTQGLLVGTAALGGLAVAAGAVLVPLGALALTVGPAVGAIGTVVGAIGGAIAGVNWIAVAITGISAALPVALANFESIADWFGGLFGDEEKPDLFQSAKIQAENQAKMSMKPSEELTTNIKNMSESRSVKVDSNIVINALPGMDVKEIGLAVRDEIEKISFGNRMGLMADT